MSKISFKIFIVILLVAFGGLIFTSIYSNYNIKSNFRDYLYREQREKVLALVEVLEEELAEGISPLLIRTIILDFIRVNQLLLRLEDLRGNIIFDFQDGMKRGMMRSNIFNQWLNNRYRFNAETFFLKRGDQKIAKIVWYRSNLEKFPSEGQYFTERVNRGILLAALLVGITTIVTSLIFSRLLTRPLLEMNRLAGKVAAGDFKHVLSVKGEDEVAALARSFNEMVDKLRYLEKIRKESSSDLAHELRTPLATLSSYLEGIKDGLVQPDQLTIAEMEEEIKRLVRLVNRLGELAEAEKKQLYRKKEQVNISEVLRKAVTRFQPMSSEQGIKIVQDIPAQSSYVSGDQDSLATIFSNLLSNALKYTEKDGCITISLREVKKRVVLKITDTGIGISREDLPFIFERFYRSDKSRSSKTGGTGIGLTITRELVQAMDGRIKVESAGKDQGTTFILSFPSLNGG